MPATLYQRSAMAALAASFPAVVLGAGVARVDFASGNPAAISADGKSRALVKGSEIEVGETVSTQAGRAQLRFSDGAYMSLQPQTEFKIEEFKFSGRPDASDNIVMNLLKGGMRTITGLIGRTNRNAYRLKTDVATIGIRGTEYSVKYTNSIEVFVADGLVSVENQSGAFTVPGGSGVMVSSQQTPPQQTDQKPVLPPESPVQREQEQQQQQVADPVNPIQEQSPPIVPVQAQLAPPLNGSLALHMTFSNYDTCQDGCNDVLSYLNNTGVLDASGGLVSFLDNFGTTTSGSTSVEAGGNDGIIGWGRWNNGVTGGDGELANYSLSGNAGALHYVVGLPATNIPTSGTGTYSMLPGGATAPTFSGNATSASVVSSSIVVDFGQLAATYHLSLTVNGVAMGTDPQNGMPLTLSGASLSSAGLQSLPITGPFSVAQIRVGGFLAGDGAVRAGAGYFITGTGGGFGEIAGAIAYIKTVQ